MSPDTGLPATHEPSRRALGGTSVSLLPARVPVTQKRGILREFRA